MYRRSLTRLTALLLVAALSACGKNAPVAPEQEEQDLFQNACARCHGRDGTGGPPDPFGNAGPRNFTDHAFQSSRTDAQLRVAIEGGNRSMPAFGAVLTPAQIGLMIAHVRKFDKTPSASPVSSAQPSSAHPSSR